MSVCTMEILDGSGHLTLSWNPNDPADVERAKAEFDTLKRAGFAFFASEQDGKPRLRIGKSGRLEGRLVQVKEFDTEAERTVAVRPMRGGCGSPARSASRSNHSLMSNCVSSAAL